MNKQAIANTLKSLQKTMRKHSPAILTGIGIAGMAAAAVMAVRATPKALRMVDDREIEDENSYGVPMFQVGAHYFSSYD